MVSEHPKMELDSQARPIDPEGIISIADKLGRSFPEPRPSVLDIAPDSIDVARRLITEAGA